MVVRAMSVSQRAIAPRPSGVSGLSSRLIVVAAILASMLFIFYSSVIAVALPQITGNIGASLDEGIWVLDAYLLSSVIAILVAPWLQIRFGRRRVVLVALAGFAASTLLAVRARRPDRPELIALRFAQGAFGGVLAPLTQSDAARRAPRPRSSISGRCSLP